MATSSIIENIRVNNPKVIEEFLKAMETSEKEVHIPTAAERSHVVSDPDKIINYIFFIFF